MSGSLSRMNTMTPELQNHCVAEAMRDVTVLVRAHDKIEIVAKLFQDQAINAAPVVNADRVCVGIITGHDLVKYEASRIELENQLEHGRNFDLARYGNESPSRREATSFDAVEQQMTSDFQVISPQDSLAEAARKMCRKHVQHLLILDEAQHPVGILSSLDILGFLVDQQLERK